MYMSGVAAVFRAILKSRNRICFEKKILTNPCEIFHSVMAFMRYWAGLFLEETQRMILETT
jgi:hypothetical protein